MIALYLKAGLLDIQPSELLYPACRATDRLSEVGGIARGPALVCYRIWHTWEIMDVALSGRRASED